MSSAHLNLVVEFPPQHQRVALLRNLCTQTAARVHSLPDVITPRPERPHCRVNCVISDVQIDTFKMSLVFITSSLDSSLCTINDDA